MPRIAYDSTTKMGAHIRQAVAACIEAKAMVARAHIAMDVASSTGTVPAALEGGDFGVAAGEGQAMWDMFTSINTLMGNVPASFLAAVDNG